MLIIGNRNQFLQGKKNEFIRPNFNYNKTILEKNRWKIENGENTQFIRNKWGISIIKEEPGITQILSPPLNKQDLLSVYYHMNVVFFFHIRY